MKLPIGLTPEEIRVLQEFRRIETETLTTDELLAIKHPNAAAGGLPPVTQLVAKGFLVAGPEASKYSLTGKAKDLLAQKPAPKGESGEAAAE